MLAPSGTTPTTEPQVSHHHKHTCRSDIRDGQEEKKKKKRPRITPSLLSPIATIDPEVDRLVVTITQSSLASTLGLESPQRSPRLKARPLLSNVAAAVRRC
jgi:hypothetical protein